MKGCLLCWRLRPFRCKEHAPEEDYTWPTPANKPPDRMTPGGSAPPRGPAWTTERKAA